MASTLNWDKRRATTFKIVSVANLILFLAVYVPLNYFGAIHGAALFLFSWEKIIPLIPWMIVPYISFNLLFIVPLMVIPSEVVRRVGVTFAITTVSAGTIFLLFPTHNAFPQIVPQGLFSSLFLGLYSVDLPSNMFPSLHVAYSTLFLLFSYPYIRNRSLKIVFVCWVGVVIASTVLTHQHHVMDVIGGLVLAGACWLLSELSTVLGTPKER